MSYQIHWSLMSLQICGKNETFEDIILVGNWKRSFLPLSIHSLKWFSILSLSVQAGACHNVYVSFASFQYDILISPTVS